MKAIRVAGTVLAALVLGLAANAPAQAHGHGRVHFGLYFGAPLGWPGYYGSPYYYPPYPYYYPPQVVVVPSEPPTYVEQSPAQAAPAPQQYYWYYCPDAKAYYPYVKQCPGAWQRVTPQPPPSQ